MSIIKDLNLQEVSKNLLHRYIEKASDQLDRAFDGKLTDKEKAKNNASKKKIGDKRIPGLERAVAKHKLKEEIEQLDEAMMSDAVKKLAHHGYKKFGGTDRVDHRTNLSHFHHAEHGHLICLDHTDGGRVKSASALRCTNSKTGEMHHEWGQEHSHVEHALSELGHKSYVGFKEEVEQVDEISKNTLANYVYKAGHKMAAHAADHALAKDNLYRAKRDGKETAAKYAGQNMRDAYAKHEKRAKGFYKAIDKLAKEEVEPIEEISDELKSRYINKAIQDKHRNAVKYDKQGNGEIVDVDRFKKRSKGINMAAKSKLREELEAIFEEGNILHKKGRPKKNRHEDGKIVND